MFDKALFNDLVSVSRICVNDNYFILREYHDRITLAHVYFLPNGCEDRYKKDYLSLSIEQLFSIISSKNLEYVNRMKEEITFINCEVFK